MTARRRRDRGAGPSKDRWVIPYADFVTLLFAFFTALYAVTSSDPGKLPTVAAATIHHRDTGIVHEHVVH